MMTAAHGKSNSAQVGMLKKNATTNPMQAHTHIRVSPSPYTWPHLQRFNTTEKPPNTGDSRSRVLAPPNTGGSAFIHRLDGRTSQSTLALPPTSFCADTRASSARAPAAGGEARLRGAGGRARRAGGRVVGPGLGAQGGD